jgi:hypothetical protein
MSKPVGYFLECHAQRLHEQLVLASKMLVKASVSEAGVSHHHWNSGASDSTSPVTVKRHGLAGFSRLVRHNIVLHEASVSFAVSDV